MPLCSRFSCMHILLEMTDKDLLLCFYQLLLVPKWDIRKCGWKLVSNCLMLWSEYMHDLCGSLSVYITRLKIMFYETFEYYYWESLPRAVDVVYADTHDVQIAVNVYSSLYSTEKMKTDNLIFANNSSPKNLYVKLMLCINSFTHWEITFQH